MQSYDPLKTIAEQSKPVIDNIVLLLQLGEIERAEVKLCEYDLFITQVEQYLYGGCLVCHKEVEFPEFTSLCNECEKRNLDYANS